MSGIQIMVRRIRRARHLRVIAVVLLIVSLIAGDIATLIPPIRVWAQPSTPLTPAAPPVLALSVPAGSQAVNTPFEVQVTVDGATNLGAFEFDLGYDPALMAVTAITLTTFLGGGADCDPTRGRCGEVLGLQPVSGGVALGAYSFGAGAGAAGAGVLATLRVQPTGRSGATALTVANATMTGADASVIMPLVQGATLEFAPPAPAMRTLYMPLVTRQGAGSAGAEDVSSTAAALTTATCPDFGGDDRVDTADVQAVASRWRQRTTDPGWDAAFDRDGSGQITITDIMAVAAAWGATCPPVLPPVPSTVAPPIDRTAATDLFDATRFLYEGDPPIQTGVTPGAITPVRAAVLRGKVLTRDGVPLFGVRITVPDHPQFGQTLSRADGLFDLAVNGGGLLTIRYEKAGYLPSQRPITPAWQSYAWLEDVVLVAYDTQTTTVTLANNPTMQVARGGSVADAAGARQATLLIPPQTQAELVLPDGATQPLTTLTVRATEYTVGGNGPAAMPGALPPQSGYTYAVELSVDEAVAAGAVDVRFDRPLYHYVENFLGFPVGSPVPAGYYDRSQAAWVPSDNGRVVKIVGVVDGRADLDTDGDGLADNDAALGISDDERARLAGLYTAGQELWRVPILHFTPWDFNWPFAPPTGATAPKLSTPQTPTSFGGKPKDEPCYRPGSIIECQNQVLGERIDLVGAPFSLHYQSDRTAGYKLARTIDIPLSGATLPPQVKRIDLEVAVAGQQYTATFPAQPNQQTTYTWDGRDGYNRLLQGVQPATVRVGYVYDGVYLDSRPGPEYERTFGHFSYYGAPVTGDFARREVTLWQEWQDTVSSWDGRSALGAWDAAGQRLGGWTLSVHHVYDPAARVLYFGSGGRQSVDGVDAIITTAPATENTSSDDIAVAADGSLYRVRPGGSYCRYVERIDPDGNGTVVAGRCDAGNGFSGDGGPATAAQLGEFVSIALGSDGTLYIADMRNHRVRRVDASGIITTIAGSGPTGFGNGGYGGDGGPATQARLNEPVAVAVAADGSFYIAEQGNANTPRVRYVAPDGTITTVAGNGVACSGACGDGGPASQSQLGWVVDLAIGPDGALYLLDLGNRRVRAIDASGVITTVAGSGVGCAPHEPYPACLGYGGPATLARLQNPNSLAVGADGSLYIGDSNNYVLRVNGAGILNPVAGNGQFCTTPDCGDDGPARATTLYSYVNGLAVAPDGSLYISNANRIRRVASALAGFTAQEIAIPSQDGSLLYAFDDNGRHLRTVNALTGATIYTFGYDAAGLLVSITDGDGDVTTISRSAAGDPLAITGAYGQATTFTLTGGYLAALTNPAGERHQFSYTADGLLTAFTTPRNQTTNYAYDALGRLVSVSDPAGGAKNLVRTDDDTGYQVVLTTGLGYTTTYRIDQLADAGERQRNTTASGATVDTISAQDGSQTTLAPDGTRFFAQTAPDPRFGMQAPIVASQHITTPGGLAMTTLTTRTVTLASPNDFLSLVNLMEQVSVNGRTFTTVYTSGDRTFVDHAPSGRQYRTIIDALGRITLEQPADLAPVHYAYNSRGLLTAVTQGDRTTTFAYDAHGYLAAITDALGRITSFTYDAAGRMTRQTFPDGRGVEYSYDAAGALNGVTPPGRPAHGFGYTAVDLVASYTPPPVAGVSTPQTTFSYNADRQPTIVTRPDGQTLTYNYDSAGRLQRITTPAGSITYGFDPVSSNLITITAPGGDTLTYTYDGALLRNERYSGVITGSVSFEYDDDFRISAVRVNDAALASYQFDADGLLTQAGLFALSRHPQNGLLAGSVLGGVNDAWDYNSFGEEIAYSAAFNGSPIFASTVGRDPLGRITTLTETVAGATIVHGYAYDVAGRLVEVRQNGAAIASYTYDSNGNRLTGPGGPGVYDAQDRLLQYGDNVYAYTSNGELMRKTRSSQVTTYSYDLMGNLRSVVLPDGRQLDYRIDGQNRRIGKQVNGVLVQGFLYLDRLNPVAEVDGSGAVTARFVYGSRANIPDYMLKGGAIYRILADHLGSPRLVVDANTGAVVQRLDYDAFGRVLTDTNPGFQPFGFAGGLYDRDTGLVRFGARDYDPETGRWTAKDPILFGGGDANLYAYANGDPVNLVDPDGLTSLLSNPAVSGSVGGAITAGGMSVPNGAMAAGRMIATGVQVAEGAAVAVSASGAGAVAVAVGGGAAIGWVAGGFISEGLHNSGIWPIPGRARLRSPLDSIRVPPVHPVMPPGDRPANPCWPKPKPKDRPTEVPTPEKPQPKPARPDWWPWPLPW